MLTWKGSSRKAPETPPMDVKVETTNATSGGMKSQVSTPDTEKCAYRMSMRPPLGDGSNQAPVGLQWHEKYINRVSMLLPLRLRGCQAGCCAACRNGRVWQPSML